MMVDITYEYVKKNFPDIIDEFERKRSNSKAAGAKKQLKDFNFSFQVSERIECLSFFDIVSGKVVSERYADYNNIDRDEYITEKIEDFKKRSGAFIEAKNSRYRIVSKRLTGELPEPIIQKYMKIYGDEYDKRKKAQNMSPEEKQAESDRLIKKLSKYSGFTAISTPIRK